MGPLCESVDTKDDEKMGCVAGGRLTNKVTHTQQ